MQTTQRRKRSGRLTNYMEELADSILAELLSESKGSRFSPITKQDIKALALNRLWPMYTTTTVGRDFLRKTVAEDQIEKDIMRELRAAISIVKSNPRS